MKTLYFDCSMGAAGDMLTAALLELMPDKDEAVRELNALGIPDVKYEAETVTRCGISGTHMSVKISGKEEGEEADSHHHCHSNLHGIEHIVKDHINASLKVKNDIISVYNLIADAESEVHGIPVTDIHFHEVGTMDAVADVSAVCYLMDKLGAEKIIASPVHVGSGHIKCAHGILPVPAPATAVLLKGIPSYGGKIEGELCTPTGAALLKYFASSFGDMPVMAAEKIGYGMGKKEFEAANCIRAILGNENYAGDAVIELSCNIDDMTAEAISFAMEQCFAAGAVEVYTIPIGMKKNRPGILFTVMCREKDREKLTSVIFRHTTTIGIRENISRRFTLERKTETVETSLGQVRRKISSGYGVTKSKFEYDDIAEIAKKNDMSISDVLEIINKNSRN